MVRLHAPPQRHHHAFHVGLGLDAERTFRESGAHDLGTVCKPQRRHCLVEPPGDVLIGIRIDDANTPGGCSHREFAGESDIIIAMFKSCCKRRLARTLRFVSALSGSRRWAGQLPIPRRSALTTSGSSSSYGCRDEITANASGAQAKSSEWTRMRAIRSLREDRNRRHL